MSAQLQRRAPLWFVVFASAFFAMLPAARAFPGGIVATGCNGCHSGGNADVKLDLTLSPAKFDPGDQVTATLTVSASGASAAGVYITTGGIGTLSPLSGEGLSTRSIGLAHTQPKAMSNGRTQFRFAFRAPAQAGAVRFSVAALATNGNGRSSGDTDADGGFQSVFGCEPEEFFYDADEDGFGRIEPATLGCKGKPPVTYTASGGDCADFDVDSYPGAEEICDGVDNNCEGTIDENATPVELWPDRDGDGYYDVKEGTPMLGCVGLSGYAAEGRDCEPDDSSVHPEAKEQCNFRDENCDGRVDEGARPTCGEGWCRRESSGCSVEQCTPGEPSVETCNYIDDDCDGQIDEDGDALCAPGEHCVEGLCSGEEPSGGGSGSSTGGSKNEPGQESSVDAATVDDDADDPSGIEGTAGAGASCTAHDTRAAPARWAILLSLVWLVLRGRRPQRRKSLRTT